MSIGTLIPKYIGMRKNKNNSAKASKSSQKRP